MELYKYSAHRNTSYLNWLRSQTCIASGQKAECAHHIRLGTNGGKGIKPSDYFCIPLTNEFHTLGGQAVHRIGEDSFLTSFKIDKVASFIQYLERYLNNMFDVPIENKVKDLSYLNQLIDLAESFNTKKSVRKKKSTTKKTSTKKVSITENEFYQKAKEQKKLKDKELRKSLKEKVPKVKVKLPKAKLKSTDSEFYQSAKELQKEYAKNQREKHKEQMSEYRKEQYRLAKQRAKDLKRSKD